MRKHIIPKVITVLFLWVLVLLPLQAGAGLPIVRSVDSSLLTQPPQSITFYVYDAQDAQEPVQIQHREVGQWQADVDLQSWPLTQERSIRFQAELSDFEFMPTNGPLWVEMEVDGVVVGERSTLAMNAAGTGGFSSAGIIESRTGGFRFPDGSVQATAASGTGSGGTVTSVTAGAGLTGGTITDAGTISIDTSQTQRRVSGACPDGSSIRAIAVDGTVSCENDDVGTGGGGGTVTSVTAGAGLTGGTITGAGTISVDTSQIQRRVSNTCPAGSSIRSIAVDGTVICENDGLGATMSDLSDHASTSGAHHSRYVDSEAVTAIKAADGTGSTLDADLLDGLHASEVIASAVAQSAVATPISSLPYTITQPGSYYVSANLDGSSGGIDVVADNVTLDLMGFTLDGGGSIDDHGVDLTDRSNVSIQNGTIRRFGRSGIAQNNIFPDHNRVLNVRVLDNGFTSSYVGIRLIGDSALITGCTAAGNTGVGIVAGRYASIKNSLARNNGDTGISASVDSIIVGNTAYSNSGTGIVGHGGSVLIQNISHDNEEFGIRGEGRNLIKDNVIHSNNLSNASILGGLRVGGKSRVVGNVLANNKSNGIAVYSSGSILKENHVTGSNPGNGIHFYGSGNYFRENTASDNGTHFNLGSFTITDGGGNVGF